MAAGVADGGQRRFEAISECSLDWFSKGDVTVTRDLGERRQGVAEE